MVPLTPCEIADRRRTCGGTSLSVLWGCVRSPTIPQHQHWLCAAGSYLCVQPWNKVGTWHWDGAILLQDCGEGAIEYRRLVFFFRRRNLLARPYVLGSPTAAWRSSACGLHTVRSQSFRQSFLNRSTQLFWRRCTNMVDPAIPLQICKVFCATFVRAEMLARDHTSPDDSITPRCVEACLRSVRAAS